MKCLSIRQPWSYLVVSGRKRIEVRTWSTPFRGDLLIHSPKTADSWEFSRFGLERSRLHFGFILGKVYLANVKKIGIGEFEKTRSLHLDLSDPLPESYAWYFDECQKLKDPIPYKGMLNLFDVPDGIIRKYRILRGGKLSESIIPGNYAGWTTGKIFGRLDCESGMRMKKENRVFFMTWEDAIDQGYRPCKKCKPTPFDTY